MGVLVDVWYLHREAILKIAGASMLIATAVIGIAGTPGIGLVFRNLALPVIGVAVVAYLVRRWYWYDEAATWHHLSPESIATAGTLSLALAVIGGAQGTSPPDDRGLIESAITRSFMTSDPANCDDLYTQGLMDQTQIGAGVVAKAQCREDEADPDHSSEADGVSISGLVVGEERATATVAVAGGALDQSTVDVRLVNEEGAWKLDRMLDVDLDRDAFDRALADRMQEVGLTGEEVDCAVKQFHREFRLAELERSAVTGIQPAEPDWGVACFTLRTLRAKLAESTRDAAEERGFPTAATRCLAERLRDLPARRVRAVYRDPDSEAIQATVRELMAACLASAASSSSA